MDENNIVPPDEAQAEQEALAEAKADEVRVRIVAELGLQDDDTNKPVIDKLVERELSHKKKLSEAIGQKIKWRDAAKVAKPAPVTARTEATPLDAETIRKQTESTVTARLEQRDLDEMEYPDEIKAEIKKIAELRGISVRKAEQDPYIQHRIAQVNATDRATNGAATRTPRSIPASDTKMPAFDFSTEEGRKQYQEWKKTRKQQG